MIGGAGGAYGLGGGGGGVPGAAGYPGVSGYSAAATATMMGGNGPQCMPGMHSSHFNTHALLDTVLDGRYRITRFLSNVTGAYGFPYQGTELATGQPVFIKILKSARDGNNYSVQRELDSVRARAPRRVGWAGRRRRSSNRGGFSRALRRGGRARGRGDRRGAAPYACRARAAPVSRPRARAAHAASPQPRACVLGSWGHSAARAARP